MKMKPDEDLDTSEIPERIQWLKNVVIWRAKRDGNAERVQMAENRIKILESWLVRDRLGE